MKTYFVDGQFVPEDQAVIPVDDLAILRGYGVCDIMRTYKGRPYFINEHINRLISSAEKTAIELPWTAQELNGIVLETLERNPHIQEANIRMIITGGSSPDFFTPQGKPRLIVMVTAIPELPSQWYTQGIAVITHEEERATPDAKVISYMSAAMLLDRAREKGATEALYITPDKLVLEGTTSNLFAFFGTTLVTPSTKVLKGITRKLTLSIAAPHFPVEERPLLLSELLAADEVFITGTNKGVVPVIRIDQTRIKDGTPGPNTRKVMALLENHAENFREESL